MEMLHLAIGMGRVWAAALLLDAHRSTEGAEGAVELHAIVMMHRLGGAEHRHHTLLEGSNGSHSCTITKQHQHTELATAVNSHQQLPIVTARHAKVDDTVKSPH